VTVAQVAASTAPGLPKPRAGGRVDQPTAHLTPSTAMRAVAIVTDSDPDGLEVLRHSTAHLLAYASRNCFPTRR
jgi:threonyl-tRNA synthetase